MCAEAAYQRYQGIDGIHGAVWTGSYLMLHCVVLQGMHMCTGYGCMHAGHSSSVSSDNTPHIADDFPVRRNQPFQDRSTCVRSCVSCHKRLGLGAASESSSWQSTPAWPAAHLVSSTRKNSGRNPGSLLVHGLRSSSTGCARNVFAMTSLMGLGGQGIAFPPPVVSLRGL